MSTRKQILEAAIKCVCGDRDEQYGKPENSFTVIGNFWNEYLISKGYEADIRAEDVAVMMCLFKIARIITGEQKTDSWIDAAGYLACGGEIATEDKTK